MYNKFFNYVGKIIMSNFFQKNKYIIKYNKFYNYVCKIEEIAILF